MYAALQSAEADLSEQYSGVLSLTETIRNLLFRRDNSTVRTSDGTSEAAKTLAWAKDTTYKLAVQWRLNSNVYQFRVAAEAEGSTFDASSWGSLVDYDGSFIVSGNEFQIGYGLFGPFHIGWIGLWNRVLTDSEIHAYH